MSGITPWPLPQWLVDNPDHSEAVRYYLRLAVACTPSGSPRELAKVLGVSANAIHIAKSRGRCSPHLAVRLEKMFGRGLFPRELLNPEPDLPTAVSDLPVE